MNTPTMSTTGRMFEVELRGETVLVTPRGNLSEFAYPAIETGARQVLTLFDRSGARNAIVDLCRMDYGGSTALGFFAELSERVRRRDGRMVFCNVSEHEHELLDLARLDEGCVLCGPRAEALEVVRTSRAIGNRTANLQACERLRDMRPVGGTTPIRHLLVKADPVP